MANEGQNSPELSITQDDPLSIAEQALSNAAITANDKKLAELNKNNAEGYRGAYFDLKQPGPSIIWMKMKDGKTKQCATFPILTSFYSQNNVGTIPDTEFQERFLRELGALRDNQTLEDFYKESKKYPSFDYGKMKEREKYSVNPLGIPNEPHKVIRNGEDMNVIASIPTKMQDAYVNVKPEQMISLVVADWVSKVRPPQKS
jgi:hypothetical protein